MSPLIDRVDAVFLDMDGTLVDTESLWFAAECEVAERFGITVPASAAAELHGLDGDALVLHLADRYGLAVDPETYLGALLPAVLSQLSLARARDGAESLVQKLAGTGKKLAVVSNSSREIVEATLAPHEWSVSLPRRFSVDEVARGKPAADLYLHAAAETGVAPERCLAIEDSSTGALAATRASMLCIGVTFDVAPELFAGITPHVVTSLERAWETLSEG